MRLSMLWHGLALGALVSGLAFAQTTAFPFQLFVTLGGQTLTVANQSTLPFATSVGQSQTAQVVATYIGSGKVTVSQAPQIFGSNEFTKNLSGTLPLTLSPGDSLSFSITFTPTNANQVTAIFQLPFTETIAASGTGNPTPTTTSGAITFQLLGSAASFVVGYLKNGNEFQLTNGQTMLFDPQPINTTAILPLTVFNIGSAGGAIENITLTGSKTFTLIGLPIFPTGLAAGSNFSIEVEYSPTAVETDTGQIQISFSDGSSITFDVKGSGITSTLVYTVVVNGKSTTITPNGTVTFPATNVGSTSTATIHLVNTGAVSTTITSINVSPQQFTINPLVLPQTLAQNGSLSFTITFAPTAPGVQTGTLFVNNDSFTLSGKGLGSELQFSYSAAGSTLIIGQNGVTSVIFSPIQVTESETVPFTITNTGTLSTVISNIAIGENPSPFSLSGTPTKLPLSLAPGASLSFKVNFAPTNAGVLNGTLLVNSTAVPLSGSASAPPSLPAYTISGPTGNVAPQTQPSVTLTLSKPYPLDLNGVLTLTTSGTLGTDPAVQFQVGNAQTGGRTVPFTIPANSTKANFAGQGPDILLQTGTVAETITLTPSFTSSSGVDLTPDNPATLEFSVPPSAPVLIAGIEAASTANGVVLNFTGYTTTRDLKSLNVQFTAAQGFTLSGGQVSVDLTQQATVWFDSTASQAFGGQFTVSVPFTFSGTVPTGDTLLQTIASFSATISNSVGTSNSVSGPIQ